MYPPSIASAMHLRKLRVDHKSGTKILILREEALPASYDDFVVLLVSRVSALEAACAARVFNLEYSVAGEKLPLRDDKDLFKMYDSGDSMFVRVELEKVTRANRHRLVAKESVALRRASVASITSVWLSTPPTSQPSSRAGTPPPAAPPPLPSPPLSLAAGRPPLPPTPPPFMSLSGQSDSNTSPAWAETFPLSHHRPMSINGPIRRSTSSKTQESASTQEVSHRSLHLDSVFVAAAGREYNFALLWRSAKRDRTGENTMGFLARPEWAAHRNAGYKRIKYSEADLTITYALRKTSMKKAAKRETQLLFTLIFDSEPLFRSAIEGIPRKLDTLTPDDFRTHLVGPVSYISTDWALLQPPPDFVPENPASGGEYHIAWVVKDARIEVSGACKRTVHGWLRGEMAEGSWANEMVSRNFPALVTQYTRSSFSRTSVVMDR